MHEGRQKPTVCRKWRAVFCRLVRVKILRLGSITLVTCPVNSLFLLSLQGVGKLLTKMGWLLAIAGLEIAEHDCQSIHSATYLMRGNDKIWRVFSHWVLVPAC